MTRIWVTNGTPTMPDILNPVTVTCDRGYVPAEVRILPIPGIKEDVKKAGHRMKVLC